MGKKPVLLTALMLMILVLVSLFIFSHNGAKESAQGKTTEAVFSPTILPSLIPTKQISQATMGETPSPTETSSAPMIENCAQVSDFGNADITPTGQLLLRKKISYSLLDLNSKKEQPFSDVSNLQEDIQTAVTSPDGKWVAYNTYASSSSLTVLSSDRKRVFKTEIEVSGIIGLTGWLDNNQLVLFRFKEESPFASTLVVNPFTSKTIEYNLEDLSNFAESLGGTGLYFESSNLVPDPTHRFIVYPQQINLITLLDAKTRKPIVLIEDKGHFKHDPLWSKNGEDFVIAVTQKAGSREWFDDWFWVSNAGEVKQITNFQGMYSYAYIKSGSRSPDERKIAFWMETESGTGIGKWVIIDINQHNRCIYIDGPHANNVWPPIWSPDSQYVAVATLDNDQKGQLSIIDAENGWGMKAAQDAVPMGWMMRAP